MGETMRDVFTGIWILGMSFSMVFGIMFPFQGYALGVIGALSGVSCLLSAFGRNRKDGDALQSIRSGYVIYCKDSGKYVTDNGDLSGLNDALIFYDLNEASDYIEFVPIGSSRKWSKDCVELHETTRVKTITVSERVL